ncbi:MAG: peptide chain release factor N(5)-glutamine methyltransferase [Leptolyngbyaceae bacterium]|nr:peptide chain release factor N(5)-glutamine methyltransferase [Leptolyngbyaceae bacterium]
METISGDRLWQWRKWAGQLASAENIPSTEIDWVLRHYIPELDALALRLETYRGASSLQSHCSLDELTRLWERRVGDRTPVQHLTGMTPWRNFSLHVSPAVLIPRPETELIIDIAVEATRHHPELRTGIWVDMGTGSGAIALGLADVFPDATIHAVDASTDALAIARKNADACGMGDRIQFHHGNWFEPIHHLQGQLSGMVSNPPYIPSQEVQRLQPEVARHEPHLALDGGTDGLDSIRYLAKVAPRYLKPGGLWLIEMMAGQAESVISILKEHPFREACVHPDLSGIHRFGMAYRD